MGGLLVSAIREQENKTNLKKAQLATMKICLEGKNWTVTYKGEAKALMEPAVSGAANNAAQTVEYSR